MAGSKQAGLGFGMRLTLHGCELKCGEEKNQESCQKRSLEARGDTQIGTSEACRRTTVRWLGGWFGVLMMKWSMEKGGEVNLRSVRNELTLRANLSEPQRVGWDTNEVLAGVECDDVSGKFVGH